MLKKLIKIDVLFKSSFCIFYKIIWKLILLASLCSLNINTIFCYFITGSASGGWIQTIKFLIMSWLFYHGATIVCKNKTSFVIFSLPVPAVGGFKPSNVESWVDCSTTVLPLLAKKDFFNHFFLLVRALGGFKPSNIGSWVDCTTAAGQNNFFLIFFPPCCASVSWTKTLRPLAKINSFSHFSFSVQAVAAFKPANIKSWFDCSTTALPSLAKIDFFTHFSLLVRALGGFKPSNFGSCVDCSTTVLPLLAKINFFLQFFPSLCKQQLDSNPQMYNHELIVLLLRYRLKPK